MKKKIFITTLLLLIMFVNVSFASYSTVTMSVVEEPICTIQLSDNSKFEKKLISKNLQNKEVTLQLQVTNEEKSNKPTGEIMLVLDNSESMKLETSTGTVRKDLVFESAKTLVSNLLKDNENLKIGVVSFSTNTDVPKEGTTEDAQVVSKLSNDSTALLNSISSIEATGPRTDLEAGLEVASGEFTKTNNSKYMIVLTDGVPNVALNYNKVYYSDDVIAKTKAKLEALKKANVNVITMLTGINTPEGTPTGASKTYNQIITEIFGTQENPTVGTFYYVTDDKVESTIKTDIYNSLVPEEKTLKDIKIVDYFPKEIIDNFDFSYVSKANIGEISATVDKTNNSITWNIPSLAIGQTATVQYKLKLKENFDSTIVNKILNTNEKVDTTYTDFDNNSQSKTSDVSPKLKLVEPPATLPKAGTTTFIAITVLAFGLLVFSITKLTILKNIIK